MKYIVSIGYKKFEFSVDHEAVYFANIAKLHSIDDEMVEIEIVKTDDVVEEVNDDVD